MSKLDPLVYFERDLDKLGLLSRKTRWRLRRDGRFPKARTVGSRHFYVAAEIHQWIQDPDGWAAERHHQQQAGA